MTLKRHSFGISILLLVVAGAIAFPIAWASDVVVTRVKFDQLPRDIVGLQGRDDRFEETVYQVLNADYHVLREYRGIGEPSIWLYIGYYGTAKGGRPSHVPLGCYTGQGFSIAEWTKIPAPEGVDGEINKMHVKRGNVHQLVLFWYQSKNMILADGIAQNLHRFKNRLLYNRDDGALVRLSTSMSPENADEALERLEYFAGELLKVLPAYWPEEGPAATARSR